MSNVGRNKDFPGVPQKNKKRVSLPKSIADVSKEIIIQLWQDGILAAGVTSEQVFKGLQERLEESAIGEVATESGPDIYLFEDIQVHASFGVKAYEADEKQNTERINLNQYVVANNLASNNTTIAIHVDGDSMNMAGIFPKDLLIIELINGALDKPSSGDIVLARLQTEDEITVKRFYKKNDVVWLMPESTNPTHEPAVVSPEDCLIVGIVRYVVHSPRNKN